MRIKNLAHLEAVAAVLRPVDPASATLGDLAAWRRQTGYQDPTRCHDERGKHSPDKVTVFHGAEYPVTICGKHVYTGKPDKSAYRRPDGIKRSPYKVGAVKNMAKK